MDLLVDRKEEKTVAFIMVLQSLEPCGRPEEEIMHRKGVMKEVWKTKRKWKNNKLKRKNNICNNGGGSVLIRFIIIIIVVVIVESEKKAGGKGGSCRK